MLRVPQQHRQTHAHGWRNAPRAGLAVTGPEGAVVPRNRRVELQLMPLFLKGRRMKEGFDWLFFMVGAAALACRQRGQEETHVSVFIHWY